MGDVVQEYPESAGFVPALDQALEQMAACGVQPRWVAGNHDLGDKPDPTMPTHPVTAEGWTHTTGALARLGTALPITTYT